MFSRSCGSRSELYGRVLAIAALKCLFMPTPKLPLTARRSCLRAGARRSPDRPFYFRRARRSRALLARSFEDFQFGVLRLLIIRVRWDPGGEFRSRCSRRAGPGRNDDFARRGIEGPFVNSPNAWLRLRAARRAAAFAGRVLYDIAGLD